MTKPLPDHMKKIADKGATEAFIRANVGHVGEECLIWPFARNKAGYGLATIEGVQSIASRWMCTLANGEPPSPFHEAAHSCGNGKGGCIHPGHLSWKTPKENSDDKVQHGTHNRGSRNGKTKLTEQDIIEIRAAPPNLRPLMEKFGVSKGCISKIRSGSRHRFLGTGEAA